MIKDAKGRKWFMRFKRYRQGWYWEALHENCGQEAAKFFKTKALAEVNARQQIQGHDAIAQAIEYFRRLRRRGTPCQLTAEDMTAIVQAGEGGHSNKRQQSP